MLRNIDIETLAAQIASERPDIPPHADRERRSFTLEELTEESPRYLHAQVRVDDEFAEALVHPGQYTTVQVGSIKPRFIVIASAPKERCWRFLIDRDSTLGTHMIEMAPGDAVTLSLPEGDGYTLDGSNALLGFATGSGVATMRPVFEHLIAHNPDMLPRTALYYGEMRAQDFAWHDDIERWRSLGATILMAREDLPEDAAQGWRYVQHAFEEHAPSLDGARVLLSGAPVMMKIVSEIMLERGVAPSSILTNI